MTEVLIWNSEEHSHLAPEFASIHAACTLENPVTVATYHPPYTEEKLAIMTKHWSEQMEMAKNDGPNIIFMAFSETEQGAKQLSGFVVLFRPKTESGPFRAEVQKLMVSPEFRRRGIAKMLMMKLDDVARACGRTYLYLSTATASPARTMYPKFGYVEYGYLPEWVLRPYTQERLGATCFYKDLRKTGEAV